MRLNPELEQLIIVVELTALLVYLLLKRAEILRKLSNFFEMHKTIPGAFPSTSVITGQKDDVKAIILDLLSFYSSFEPRNLIAFTQELSIFLVLRIVEKKGKDMPKLISIISKLTLLILIAISQKFLYEVRKNILERNKN